MSADPIGDREQRDAMIVAYKQAGLYLAQIADLVSLSKSRVQQILSKAGAACDVWVCPLCGYFTRTLGPLGFCTNCEDAEEGFHAHHHRL